MVVPNVHGSSVRKLLHVSLLANRILMWLLELWKIFRPCDMGQAICMYSILAVSASCNMIVHKGMSILSTYKHIYRGFCTAFVTDICIGMSMHTVLQMFSCIFYRVGLAPYSPVLSNLVWHGPFWHWIHNVKTTSHI